MSVAKQLFVNGKKIIWSRRNRGGGKPRKKEKAKSDRNDASPTETQSDINLVSSNDQTIIEQHILQLIRNMLSDPKNILILKECLALCSDEKSQLLIERLQHGPTSCRQPRDISNYEIIRPRDLPQCTGLSRTNIWRLEKKGEFVPRIKLSSGAIGYDKKLILEWLKAREEV